MPKRKNPETSLQAYRELSVEQINSHHAKIIGAFKKLGSATADDISVYTGMDHVQINRRFIELRDAGIIYNTFEKKLTRKGRNAYKHALAIKGEIVEKKPEKAMPGKSVSDYSKEIGYIQQNLF